MGVGSNRVESFPLDLESSPPPPPAAAAAAALEIHKVSLPQEKTTLEALRQRLAEVFFPDDPLHHFKNQTPLRTLILALRYFFPILHWGSDYTFNLLKSDAVSGLTIASLAIPQGISYAKLANLPPVIGLYSSFVPPLIYSVLGSSRDLAVGPVSIASLVMGSMLREVISPEKEPILYLQLAFTATFFAGVFQASLGLLRLGFVVDFLSKPTLIGFMGGAAVIVSLQQLKGLLGIVHVSNLRSMAPAVVTIGGKGSSLSPLSVYSIAAGLSKVKIDSSALEKLSQSSKKPVLISPPKPPSPNPRPLTLEESRAALAVLLNKLVQSDSTVRPALPLLIEETLNLDCGHETLDFGSSVWFLDSISRLNGKNIDEIGVTSEEIGVIENAFAGSVGICGILDCCASALVRLSDALAALSCEAARVDKNVIDVPVSGDGFSIKDETNVAADMKVLLADSKLADKVDSGLFAEVPTVNASFREAVRSLHSRVRVELNSVVKVKKTSVGAAGNSEKEKAFVASVLPLAMSVQSASESSLGRTRMAIESVGDQEHRAKMVETFEKGCPGLDKLKEDFRLVTVKASSGSDNVGILHCVYGLLLKYREVLAWEAAVALFVLDVDESIEKPQVGPPARIKENGENSKGDKKDKKKKKKALGKGTSVVRQLLKDRLMGRNEASIENVAVLVDWAQGLLLYFDPKDSGLDFLLYKLKEIVESNDNRRLPKIPKGTRDFGKDKMAIRERAFSIIVNVFKKHGAVGLDTPVFELRETLMGKYGEDSKLIYDLADQGGELCSLRYDLTVPFARYLAMNNINALKRYQIAKVYRRDNPSKGRFREFYQCDFDIAGKYEVMEPDFEVIKVLTELLNELNIGEYEIKLNHRKLLDGMLEICGVPSEKFRTVCSSIDKLDKQSFEEIKKELVDEKGLSVETAEKIGALVKKRGPPLEVLSELKSRDSPFLENAGSVLALNDLEVLFIALERSRCLDKVVFDLSLARGLDYYTGVIFEAVFKGATQVGSIAAGGRYDNLVGMFSGKQVPAVGVSLGIERVFAIMEQLENERNQVTRATETQVLVAILAKDLPLAAELVSELWDAKIKAEFGLTKRVMNHINRAKESGIPWMVLVGESEVAGGIVKLKNIEANQEEEVPRGQMVEELKRRLDI